MSACFTRMDAGTLCRSESPGRAVLGLEEPLPTYSYSISGKYAALGGMFVVAAIQRLPGTWYDRTVQVNQARASEASLGSSGFGDAESRQSSRRITQNLRAPASVDVDVHFETKGRVETIVVRGDKGSRSFIFDFNEAEAAADKLPEGADVFQPFYDMIDKILAAVVQLR